MMIIVLLILFTISLIIGIIEAIRGKKQDEEFYRFRSAVLTIPSIMGIILSIIGILIK